MNIRSFFLFIFLLPAMSIAQVKPVTIVEKRKLEGGKDFPIELNLLINSYQLMAPERFERLLTETLLLDRYARTISKEDLFLIGKIEIYRTFLMNASATRAPLDGVGLKVLRDSLAKTTDPFIKWFLNSLIQDAVALLDLPLFKEYLLQQSSPTIDINKYRRVLKKSQLIQNWVQKLNPEALDFADTLKTLMLPKMEEALKNVNTSLYWLAAQNLKAPMAEPVKNEQELKFFTIKVEGPKEPVKPAIEAPKEKSVEEIIAPVLGPNSEDLPLPSSENWLEDENTPPGLQNLPKPASDADWLQDI